MTRRGGVSSPGGGSVAIGGDAYGPVSATYIGTQVLGASSVPVTVAVRDPRAVFAAAGVEGFTGRDWLVAELDQFMAGNSCGYVFVEADAGLGKTAFAAWLAMTRGYVSHFSRYSGGRLSRTALQNLSAQLITGFALDDQAPGGMLPEWTQTPAGFESLLSGAAQVASQRQERVVLVVDGLDEAQPSDDDLPFGFPGTTAGRGICHRHLPDRVLAGRPECPAMTVRIGKNDPRNKADIGMYLARAAREDILASRLAEAGTDPADFAALLPGGATGCGSTCDTCSRNCGLDCDSPERLATCHQGFATTTQGRSAAGSAIQHGKWNSCRFLPRSLWPGSHCQRRRSPGWQADSTPGSSDADVT